MDEFHQPVVPKSKYQLRLDEGHNQVEDGDKTSTADIRYWSDYSHVFYHPRTPQRLPDVADYENTEGDWVLGMDTFTKYAEVRYNLHALGDRNINSVASKQISWKTRFVSLWKNVTICRYGNDTMSGWRNDFDGTL